MKKTSLIIITLLLAAYIFNSKIAETIYPDAKKVHNPGITYDQYFQYNIEFSKYYILRNQIYEAMFCMAFLLIFINTKGLIRSLAIVGFFLSCASVIDKTLFNITQFKVTDYFVYAAAISISIYVYYREQNGTDQRRI